jgi:MerC mercury resistance protein
MELSETKSVRVLDRAGMSASLACAVHCAVLPLLLAALPAIGLAWLDSPWVDWTIVALAAAIALRAHRGGFQVHRRCLPAGVAVTGLLIIVTTICVLKGSANHHYIQASGAVVVASSHFLNRHLCRNCKACSTATSEER